MKILLDSCALVDIAMNAPSLTNEAKQWYGDKASDIYVSLATIWELGMKYSLGKLDFNINDAIDLLRQNDIGILTIDLPVSILVNKLPYHHKDPFDRLIIATAMINDFVIMTSDSIIGQYDVSVINSR